MEAIWGTDLLLTVEVGLPPRFPMLRNPDHTIGKDMQSQAVLDEVSIPSFPQHLVSLRLGRLRRMAASTFPPAAISAYQPQDYGLGTAKSFAGTARSTPTTFEWIAFLVFFAAMMAFMASSGFLFRIG